MKIKLIFMGVILTLVGLAEQSTSLLEIRTGYKYGGEVESRALRSEVYKWEDFFVRQIQTEDKAVSMALSPGLDMHANTKHEALRYFNHRVECLAWCVTNQQQAVEFTNIVERWMTNLPTGPE
jgi:hypothetical protein